MVARWEAVRSQYAAAPKVELETGKSIEDKKSKKPYSLFPLPKSSHNNVMPTRQRIVYPVATLTVAAIVGIGFLTRAARPFLPPEKANALATESAAYLIQGSRQQVQWHPFGLEAFQLARSSNKPILLMMGTEWSALGRQCDRDALSDPDVEAFLARYMVCIRLDLDERPQWRSQFLPYSKTQQIHDPGFQIVFLDPEGRPYFDGGTIGYGPQMNSIEVTTLLQTALRNWEQSGKPGSGQLAVGIRQAEMAQSLLQPSLNASPRFDIQFAVCARMIDPKGGGFRSRGFMMPNPNALRFLLYVNAFDQFRAAVEPLVRGNLVDWMDGGFFYQSEMGGRRATRFDKVAVLNAEMMEVLAEAGVILNEPLYLDIARRTFDFLTGDISNASLPSSARIGDEELNGRSSRSSIPVRKLRETLENDNDRTFARDYMGLRVETNPMMTVTLPRDDAIFKYSSRFETILEILRKAQPRQLSVSTRKFCDVSCNVLARLQRTAIVLNDSERLKRADLMWQAIQAFRFSDDVTHMLSQSKLIDSYLGDYLAMADACLNRFLATGDSDAFEKGLLTLTRAEFLFASDIPGVWVPGHFSPETSGIQAAELPEVLDTVQQSLTAQTIRLCLSYGRLLSDSSPSADNSLARKWSQTADTMVRHFADESDKLAFSGSGYFNSALDWERRIHAITVGPKAVELAASLSWKAPFLLVAPAKGRIRPSLQNATPGIYIVQVAMVEGPYTEDEAIAVLNGLLR